MFFRRAARVVVKNKNLAFEAKIGANLYQVLISENVISPLLCNGNGQCGKCKIKILSDSLPKPTWKEKNVLASISLNSGYRLACQTVIKGAMEIDTSEIGIANMPEELFFGTVKKVAKTSDKHIFHKIDKVDAALTDIPIAVDDIDSSVSDEDIKLEDKNLDGATLEHELSSGEYIDNVLNKVSSVDEVVIHDDNTPKMSGGESFAFNNRAISDFREGILFIKNKNSLRYFLYSSDSDGIKEQGVIEDAQDVIGYLSTFSEASASNNLLSDYIYNVLGIKNIDRIIVISDDPTYDGEPLFDLVNYTPFDIGATQCELIRPQTSRDELTAFYRMLNVRGANRLMVSLDNISHSYYFSNKGTFRIPALSHNISDIPDNIFNKYAGKNPIVHVSDDLKVAKAYDKFNSPDGIPVHILIKYVSILLKMGVLDSTFKILPRSQLNGKVPIDVIIKIAKDKDTGQDSFYVYRDQYGGLYITQEVLTNFYKIKEYISKLIAYAEQNLGAIESIILNTPADIPGFVGLLVEMGIIPKKYKGSVINNYNDSSVIAVKLFQEPDVRQYMQRYFGNFYISDMK